MRKRREFTPEFKARIVLEMLAEQKSAALREMGAGLTALIL